MKNYWKLFIAPVKIEKWVRTTQLLLFYEAFDVLCVLIFLATNTFQ